MNTETTMFSPESGLIDQETFLRKIASADLPIITNNKKIFFYNIPAAFDIEVSSFYNGVDFDSTGKEHPRKCASMYIWQFGILNWVTYGRTWGEFLAFMNALSTILALDSDMRLVIYVHNLAYEFQFMRKLITWDKVFLLDDRKPVYAIWGGFEFRCSLKLSSKSLAKVGEDLVKYREHKHVGDLDYQLIRFHSTPLTKEELGYCEADIRVLLAYIQEKIESDGSISSIPMTNTGYVRNYCRKECFKHFKSYRKLMSELTLDADEYTELKRGFSGGFTHASAKYVAEGKEKPLEDVGSFDFTSSYPAVMLTEKFPMSKSRLVDHIDDWNQFHHYLTNYCCLFDITVYNVYPKVDYDHPVSFSKLILPSNPDERRRVLNGITVDNGRVVTAEEMTITMTEQDWFTFCDFYNFGDKEGDEKDFQIHHFRIYEKGYLPKEFFKAILELYRRKTVLKDVEGEEINYMISKNMLNAAYGMIVTDIVRDILEYDTVSHEYEPKRKPNLVEAVEKYNNATKRFLFYPWGVWVTAYARRNLFTGILACGDDYIYSDTDSIKIFNPEKHMDYIDAYNRKIMHKVQLAAAFFGIDSTEFAPKNKKGIAKPIGVWEYEGKYKRFKTLGAKRYLVQKQDDSYILTVAGVNKKKACKYLETHFDDPFDGFTHEMCVPAEYSGRLTLTYKDDLCEGEEYDYLGRLQHFREESSIHMEPSDYNLTMSEEYRGFLNYMFGIVEDSW